jgi:hypothetical protein
MASYQAQEFLFQRIKELLPHHVSLVDAVAEILHVSADSAYRRIRGETPLVLDEAKELSEHFHLSLDQLLNITTGFTLFQSERLHHKTHTFENYLKGILRQLQQVNGFIKKEIIYLSKDIPLFHNFLLPPLAAFRYFFWMKSILRHPDFETKGFQMDCFPDEMKKIAGDMVSLYNSIPSIEIWNTECVNSLIFQVEYYKDAGYFSAASDIKTVYDAAEEILWHLKTEAEHGCKFLPGENPQTKKGNFKFFYNRITLGDNTIMATTDNIQTVFLNYDVMNYMVTRDIKFCICTYSELQSLMKRSTQISSTSEKQRNIFFGILTAKIQDRKKNL